MTTLFFFHDPMCSWCWGYRPTSDSLFAALPEGVQGKKIVGGLAPDSDEPMPQETIEVIVAAWRRIQAMLGTDFNFDFWKNNIPRRSTYPACRAVIAAGYQDREDDMTNGIQRAYYLKAMNPSDVSTLETIAGEIGLDTRQFSADLGSPDVEKELQQQVGFTRQAGIRGFPSIALEHNGDMHTLVLDYESHEVTLQQIVMLCAR